MWTCAPAAGIGQDKRRKQVANLAKNAKAYKSDTTLIDSPVELRAWASQHLLPPSLDEMEDYKTYVIPVDPARYTSVTGVVVTMKTQVEYIGQCAANPDVFMLHVDGKHKLHHGRWILVSVGTHSTKLDSRHGITHSYRPMLYMFCKQHESTDSIAFLLETLQMYRLTTIVL